MTESDEILLGERALKFKNSEHWLFFRDLCAIARDQNLSTDSADETTQLQRFACAAFLNDFPDKVNDAIKRREAILKRAEKTGTVVAKVLGAARRAFSPPNPS